MTFLLNIIAFLLFPGENIKKETVLSHFAFTGLYTGHNPSQREFNTTS